MEIRLRNENPNFDKSLVELICENRGVDFSKIEEFCDPTFMNVQNPFDYLNMEKAIDRYLKAIENKENIGILIDSDVDGYCSASTLVQTTLYFFKHNNINVFMHDTKSHGLTKEIMSKILNSKIDLLVIADASSNDYKQHKILRDNNIDIVILDHHEAEKYSENAIVVNNQLQEGVNKNLCGMGIVQKFLEAIEIKYKHTLSEYFLDLTAISLVSDCMNMNNLENRYYVNKGLRNLNNKLLLELFSDNITRDYQAISFDIAPTINAFIRVASKEERMDLFFALCGVSDIRDITIKGLGEMKVNLQEYIKRMANRIKSRQNKMIKEIMESDETQIISEELPFSVIILPSSANKNLTGLVASRFVEKLMKPALVLKQYGSNYAGSARTTEGFKNFKDYIKEIGIANFAEGHQEAFGVAISWDNLLNLKLLNSMKHKDRLDEYILVDKIYDNNLFPFDVMSVGELEHQWSRGFEEPLFLVKINRDNIEEIKVCGSKKNTVRFKFNKITFIKFECDDNDIDELLSDKDLEIVCNFKINEWNERYYPQCEIKHFNVFNNDKFCAEGYFQNEFKNSANPFKIEG